MTIKDYAWYLIDTTPNMILTMSYWLFAKLLSFTTDIDDGSGGLLAKIVEQRVIKK